ncbi:hypothetical protein VQ574_07820 [Stutzerimonas frequens]|uniref:hypothetical protein n=1 Tax=Stutzerimonas frequens TaxID=2968969 RepID=UPI002DB7B07D|nr:hypothetical protein [Stutzerimonas frequens]WRW28620.1 hypothetical protein VQ574_07820 [Stutzerimonas frequens]
MDDVFQQMTSSFFSPEIQGCLSVVESVAGYRLSAADRQPFLYFHNYLTNPQPDFITEWRGDAALEKWYHRFTNGILGDVQNTLACVLYHHDRLAAIEREVMEGIEQYNYRRVLGNSTVGLGNTLVWDFEYQAFILAFRRCLDYLARAISTYFKNDFHSFRRLGDFLGKQNKPLLTDHLIELHSKYSLEFDFVLSEGTRKSIRDKISHYEYVPVGCINLSQRGFMLAGGGEELGISGKNGSALLSEVIQGHVTNLRGCVREFIGAYVDGMRVDQHAKKV